LFSIFIVQNEYKTTETIYVTKVSAGIFSCFTDNQVKSGESQPVLNSASAECLIIFDNKLHI